MRCMLLGHRQVAAAQAGLDVRERHRRLGRGARAGEGRVRVSVDEHEIGRLALEDNAIAGCISSGSAVLEIEPVAAARQAELLEEDVGELAVVVLAGVDDDLVDPASRSATESGAALMNCGRFPTTVRTFTERADYWPTGHQPSCPGMALGL